MEPSRYLGLLVKFEQTATVIAKAIITEPNLKPGGEMSFSFEKHELEWPYEQYDLVCTAKIFLPDRPDREMRLPNRDFKIGGIPRTPETIHFFYLLQERVKQVVLAGSHGKIFVDGEPAGHVICAKKYE